MLVKLWPSFTIYLVSFFLTTLYWVNHHILLAQVRRLTTRFSSPRSRRGWRTARRSSAATATATGGGAMTFSVSPAVVTSGPFQNVTAFPQNGATVNVLGGLGAANVSSPQGLAFHKDAFALGSADLPLPGGVDMAARVADKQLGLSIRLVRAYDINTDRFPTRTDLLYGWTTLYPELACRVAS